VTQRTALVTVIVLAALVTAAAAQEAGYRAEESPFQGSFDYRVNDDLQPMVEVAGVRWTRFGVFVKGDRELDPEKETPVTVELGFVNTNSDSVKVLVIALFEDDYGVTLDRLECAKVKANKDALKEAVQKYKISGAVLQATRRVYLFCEVER
jgi:hypothetical protein